MPVNSATEKKLKTAALSWLSPLQMIRVHQSIAERAQEGSGRWFLTSEQFLKWQSGNEKLLWCSGMRMYFDSTLMMFSYLICILAGAGKTVIAYNYPVHSSLPIPQKIDATVVDLYQVHCGGIHPSSTIKTHG